MPKKVSNKLRVSFHIFDKRGAFEGGHKKLTSHFVRLNSPPHIQKNINRIEYHLINNLGEHGIKLFKEKKFITLLNKLPPERKLEFLDRMSFFIFVESSFPLAVHRHNIDLKYWEKIFKELEKEYKGDNSKLYFLDTNRKEVNEKMKTARPYLDYEYLKKEFMINLIEYSKNYFNYTAKGKPIPLTKFDKELIKIDKHMAKARKKIIEQEKKNGTYKEEDDLPF